MKKKKLLKNNEANNKWEKCLGCQYNHHKPKKNIKKGDYQLFNCFANIDTFQCEMIPELYPEKLFEKLNIDMEDGKVIASDNSFELLIFSVEFWDSINDNVIRVIVASDSKENIEKHFNKVTKNKKYNHLQLFRIVETNSIFKNYTILVVPQEVNKVFFPELSIETEHYGKSITMKDIVYEIRRHPGSKKEKCKDSHIKIDEKLTVFEEK